MQNKRGTPRYSQPSSKEHRPHRQASTIQSTQWWACRSWHLVEMVRGCLHTHHWQGTRLSQHCAPYQALSQPLLPPNDSHARQVTWAQVRQKHAVTQCCMHDTNSLPHKLYTLGKAIPLSSTEQSSTGWCARRAPRHLCAPCPSACAGDHCCGGGACGPCAPAPPHGGPHSHFVAAAFVEPYELVAPLSAASATSPSPCCCLTPRCSHCCWCSCCGYGSGAAGGSRCACCGSCCCSLSAERGWQPSTACLPCRPLRCRHCLRCCWVCLACWRG